MDIDNVREALYDATEAFFRDIPIIWAETITSTPELPYITLKTGRIKRTNFPVGSDDGVTFYQCSTTWEVNLYTQGKPVTIGNKVTGNYSNTSTSDLMEFFNFLDSEMMLEKLPDLDIMLEEGIKDLSFLENEVGYRYRAMGEAIVSFPMQADGGYGVGGVTIPNYSKGGSIELQEEMPTIENVTIELGGKQ